MRIVITTNADQKALLTRAAAAAGLPLSLWIRATSIAAARGLGVPDPERARKKAAHDEAVAARREAREARKAAMVTEDAAWAELARCQEAVSVALTGGDADTIAAAEAARGVADAAAVAAQQHRESFE